VLRLYGDKRARFEQAYARANLASVRDLLVQMPPVRPAADAERRLRLRCCVGRGARPDIAAARDGADLSNLLSQNTRSVRGSAVRDGGVLLRDGAPSAGVAGRPAGACRRTAFLFIWYDQEPTTRRIRCLEGPFKIKRLNSAQNI
jgi:hypothetical protein